MGFCQKGFSYLPLYQWLPLLFRHHLLRVHGRSHIRDGSVGQRRQIYPDLRRLTILDRTHLIDRWFRLIKGRSWKRLNIFYATKDKEVEDIARIVFTAIVQTVADNTIHLILMYIVCLIFL